MLEKITLFGTERMDSVNMGEKRQFSIEWNARHVGLNLNIISKEEDLERL